ncbi:nucleotidyltransferase [Tissierella sp. MSJ-40]|uniref:tRNA(Met) cytidine acetate ligase n=1 Tax=Tissierella simiarum TaxID=2841534 RepID=A0ABS6E4A7_9FIRM|nr:nucleotidyltransferase [Tissierella simiarum]MBU5437743.1 nucleotidyltransferase [Tissierella simiarum]
MKVIGFITEYNPFHLGHKYHLDKAMSLTQADYSLAIMSGSFVQRGEPSFIDKWTKARMAVDNGIDLVLELPFIFSTQSAELFAYGGIKLMDSLNIVDSLAFGSEIGEIFPLEKVAKILSEEPYFYRERLKHYLSEGYSFSVSRSNALEDYLKQYNLQDDFSYKNILNKSNNILGIEYLKALIRINSSINPVAIKRIGSEYNDTSISNDFASATAIRHSILNNGLESVNTLVPDKTYDNLKEYLNKYHKFNLLENYNQILLYLLRTKDKKELGKLLDMETGLENRILKESFKNNNIKEIIDKIITKRYPRTRIQRLLIHLISDLDKLSFKQLFETYPSYARVLGANKNGLVLLKKIKEKSNLPIITKFADHKKYNDISFIRTIEYEKKATELYFLGLNHPNALTNMDYYNSPYIK